MPLTPTQRRLALSAVLLVIAGGLAILFGRGPGPGRLWHLDLNSGELFPATMASAAPIAAPSGPLPDGSPAGVLAMVVVPAGGGKPEIAYIQRFTAEARSLRERQLRGEVLASGDEDRITAGIEVAAPPDTPGLTAAWHGINTRAGEAIIARLQMLLAAGGRVDLPR